MKYICKICGFIYDDSKQQVLFDQLPDTWKCPVCGAAKSDFELLADKPEEPVRKAVEKKPVIDEDIIKMSPQELSALCSNLARGCEKQYRSEESKLYTELADYFKSIAPQTQDAEVGVLGSLLEEDINEGYPNLRSIASENKDRGTLRVCTWGEKVTRMLSSLVQRYEKEGLAFLDHTEVWVCTVCGFVYIGETPPELCPVCKVPSWKFEKMERRQAS